MKNKLNFNELPKEVQQEVKKCLSAYDECRVDYEYGKYDVDVNIGVKAKYGEDYEWIGKYNPSDVWTLEEYRKVYKETFGYNLYGTPYFYQK